MTSMPMTADPTTGRPAAPVAPELDGYEFGDVLGFGGSGVVWSGVRCVDGRLVALKVLGDGTDENAVTEAALVDLTEEGVLTPQAVLRSRDSAVVIVTDLLPGGSLASQLDARGHFSAGECVTILAPVASALGRLHRRGVTHGDVSPGNVLLDAQGRPVLADLGVARLAGDRSVDLWASEGFAAPEVERGSPPSPASDVYAVGALGWFALTGSVPGPHVYRAPLAERSRAGVGAEALVEVLGRALRSDPSERPDADTLAWEIFESAPAAPLRLVVAGEDDVSTVTRRIRSVAAEDPGPARHGRPRRWTARRGVFLTAAALVSTVVVVGVSVRATDGAQAQAGQRVSAPVEASGTAASMPAEAAASAALLTDPAAPTRDPVGVLELLSLARAAAWRSGTLALLSDVDAPGSPAMAQDVAALGEVARAGARYLNLSFVVREAEVATSTPTTVTLRARVDTTAYTIRDPGGSEQQQPAAGEPVMIDLVLTKGGWRVQEVRAVEGVSNQ